MLDGRVDGGRANAVLGWTTIGIVALGAVEGFLTRVPLWGGFSPLVAVVASVPAPRPVTGGRSFRGRSWPSPPP